MISTTNLSHMPTYHSIPLYLDDPNIMTAVKADPKGRRTALSA